jgi:hypothetical protein
MVQIAVELVTIFREAKRNVVLSIILVTLRGKHLTEIRSSAGV